MSFGEEFVHAFQQTRDHQQAQEENKLRMLVLKHQIDGLKIEDQIRSRNLAMQNLQLLHGQPAADIPSDTVTTPTPNLPSTGLAGMVSGLVRGRQGMNATATPDTTQPEFTPAPDAQASQPGTHDVQSRVARPVPIPGVGNVPGVNVRPQSMEDIIRASISAEMAKPYTLAPDARRFVGASEVARGGSKNVIVPRGGTLANEGTGEVVATGQPAAKRGRSVSGRLNGKDAFAVFDPETEQYTIGGKDVTGAFQPRPTASDTGASDREAQRRWSNKFRQYTSEVGAAQKTHAEAFRAWQKSNETALPGQETPAPVYTPPSFDEWQVDHPDAGETQPARGKGKGPVPAPSAVKQPTDPLQAAAADPKTGKVQTFTFPTKAAADAFRKDLGIR